MLLKNHIPTLVLSVEYEMLPSFDKCKIIYYKSYTATYVSIINKGRLSYSRKFCYEGI